MCKSRVLKHELFIVNQIELCEQMNISFSELARRIGQTPQDFNKKTQANNGNLEGVEGHR